MNNRAYALDALRGYAIITMVLSATIVTQVLPGWMLTLIHISEPTRLRRISYALFCLKKKTQNTFQAHEPPSHL